MTIPEYIRAALEASGLSEYKFRERIDFCISSQGLKSCLKGECSPLASTLLKVEAFSGLSLDLVDARIKRGIAYFQELDKHIYASQYSIREIAEAVGVNHEVLRRWAYACRAGGPPQGSGGAKIKPGIAINLCDFVEGRLEVRRHRKATNPSGRACKYGEENPRANLHATAIDGNLPIDTRRAIEIMGKINLGPVRLRKIKKIEDSLHTFEYGPYDCTLDLRRTPGTFMAVYHPTGQLSVYREVKHT